MTDFVLEITYESDPAVDEEVQSRLFLGAANGSSSIERDGHTTVTAYFESPETRAAGMESLRDVDAQLRTDDRARVDWLKRYEQSLEPLLIGRSFVVAPDARLIGRTGRMPIIVPQEQAFGTGSHETTSLCIEMLERIDVRGKRSLDVGAGSGILAIAMIRLGAERVIAFDNDLDAFGPLRDNRMRNGVEMPTFIGGMEALRGGVFDIITMNIVPEVIIPLLPKVIAHLDGDLILSGILTVRRDDVVAAATALRLVEESRKGEWWCGRFQRGAAR